MSMIWKDGRVLDGTLPQLFHDDAGFVNALGVFDSMLAVNGVLMDALEHFERLVRDAEIVLGISASWLPMFSQMTEAWLPLLVENRLSQGHARIRTIVTGGISDRPLGVSETPSVIVTVSGSAPPDELPPLTCAIVREHPRIAGSVLENCKRLDYTRSLAARREAAKVGADDAILPATNGMMACGTTSNLFIEENGVLVTPPLTDGVLAGVTRMKLIRDNGAREESISDERLRAADRIFLTNSFWGLRPASLVE